MPERDPREVVKWRLIWLMQASFRFL